MGSAQLLGETPLHLLVVRAGQQRVLHVVDDFEVFHRFKACTVRLIFLDKQVSAADNLVEVVDSNDTKVRSLAVLLVMAVWRIGADNAEHPQNAIELLTRR